MHSTEEEAVNLRGYDPLDKCLSSRASLQMPDYKHRPVPAQLKASTDAMHSTEEEAINLRGYDPLDRCHPTKRHLQIPKTDISFQWAAPSSGQMHATEEEAYNLRGYHRSEKRQRASVHCPAQRDGYEANLAYKSTQATSPASSEAAEAYIMHAMEEESLNLRGYDRYDNQCNERQQAPPQYSQLEKQGCKSKGVDEIIAEGDHTPTRHHGFYTDAKTDPSAFAPPCKDCTMKASGSSDQPSKWEAVVGYSLGTIFIFLILVHLDSIARGLSDAVPRTLTAFLLPEHSPIDSFVFGIAARTVNDAVHVFDIQKVVADYLRATITQGLVTSFYGGVLMGAITSQALVWGISRLARAVMSLCKTRRREIASDCRV